MKRISIDPITRLEGHGKIEIFLNDQGNVENCYFQVPELRGFERFCVGRPVEELPRIVTRICGVCPGAHHMASGKAVDAVYHVDIPSVAKKLRELYYSAHFVHSHIAHFYALGGPDFVMGPDSDPAKRNILGVIEKVGLEVGGSVIKHRAYAQDISQIITGRSTHLVWALPGGVSKGITKEDRDKIAEMGKSIVEFTKFSLKLFDDVVLKNKAYVDLILGDAYKSPTYYMGLVDKNNKVNFYEGDIRVVDHEGKEFHKFKAAEYLDYIAEHVEPYTYLKFPYLKKIGWKGLVYGKDNGIYRAVPLSRLNAADGMATPIAQAEYEKYFSTLGGKPVHAVLAMHWARLIELVYAAERLMELINDPEITDPKVRVVPTATPTEGVGVVEAQRGTLYHHYATDANGIVTKVNLLVGTTNNHAAISLSIKQAAEKLITAGNVVSEGLLNMVEMAFRAYDPCFSCATHTLPGEMPLAINIYDKDRNLLQTVSRNV
jgi:F420-non-reducing hydrogenase large subunit